VKPLRKIVGVLMMGLVFGSPVMACLVPDAEMSAAERECCKHMAQECGSMNMPSSHSCCETEVRQAAPMLHVEKAQAAPQVTAAIIVTSPAVAEIRPFHLTSSETHSPPESPPSSTSILRI